MKFDKTQMSVFGNKLAKMMLALVATAIATQFVEGAYDKLVTNRKNDTITE